LSDIAALGSHYPPALEAMKTRRDTDRAGLSMDQRAAAEFGAINRQLGEDGVTLEAFDKLPADSRCREALGHWVFDALLEAKRYPDAVAAFPAVKFRAQFDRMRGTPNPNDSLKEFIVDSAAKELEALAGAGQLDDARGLLTSLLGYDRSEVTISVVRDHLERAGHADLMPSPSTTPAPPPVL
jgi:hypothetical protein